VQLVQLTVTEGNAGAAALCGSLGFDTYGVEPMAMKIGDGYFAKRHLWRRLDRPCP